ncbi:MAG: DUF1697 domain-containing protein [Actinobacteria bacterium]|nr:DUF1697 domain-containing protein [Actinomycetota bacterium]
MTGPDEQPPAPATRVALLRGINLGGGRTLPMADLRTVAEGLGWTRVSTYLQSGNLVFAAVEPDEEAARRLSAAISHAFGLAVDVVIRSGAEVRALVDAHPFAGGDPSRVVIACCDRPVGELAARRLAELATGSERVEVAPTGVDVYADFPDGQAGSKLAANLVAILRPGTGTARNLRTMTKVAELLG